MKNVLYEVSGILTDSKRQDVVHATCLALMANPSEVEKQTRPEFYARSCGRLSSCTENTWRLECFK